MLKKPVNIHPDFNEFVAVLDKNKVEYVIVGSYALAFHGYPRATGDIDFWIRPTPANLKTLFKALSGFGFQGLDISEHDLIAGKIIQLGYSPYSGRINRPALSVPRPLRDREARLSKPLSVLHRLDTSPKNW